MSRTGSNIKLLAEQLQNIQSRFAQMQKCTGELLSQQQQLEIIATALEDLGSTLEELQVANRLISCWISRMSSSLPSRSMCLTATYSPVGLWRER